MVTIFYAEPELVIGLNRKILFLNPNDLQIFKEIELSKDLTTCGLKSADEPPPAANDTNETTITSDEKAAAAASGNAGGAVVEVSIQQVCYSPDRQFLALTTAGQKALLLYKSRPEHAKLLSVRSLARASSALAFASDSSSVLVADKTGDCYQYDCCDVEATPRMLFGHLSIVYDILWTPDQGHIITCDRDDKIRVTNYPATYDIHSYCLGHKEFVSSLGLLQERDLISVSGDKTLRVWNYIEGKQLLEHELPAPAVRLQMDALEGGKRYQLAILFYDHSDALGLYDLERSADQSWSVVSERFVRADAGSWNFSNFAIADNRIYVAGATDERLSLRVYNRNDGEAATSVPAGWLDMVHEQFSEDVCIPEDLSVWFKKRYDNISEYMERKKRRIEDKQQKC
ncbi:tRNA (guanine-N(7)-)-methyltransferase non-catalytic subunit wuho [Scaptodrosophila lebanonensis]|uniref:tRNA (Guanine-N(7)-)-methyltransferase non-catalytic subunit wuho n=1 Tax=Drosophila lebanonensis TaxID=7225 RepID=A0A6J2UGD5_DROLE|nr:tRNA (guanine-N(7)-)-methyltransferase non-catalytic subunit wuho [Scaptodrosophila lebanonensis]